MKTTRNILTLVVVMALMVGSAHATSLTLASRTLVSTNNANFDISVYPGAAMYNNRGVGGSEPGAPTFTNTLGDGTVLDFNFFHSPNDTIVSYAKGGAGRISDATCPSANVNGSGENWSNVWTTTDPAGFTALKDFRTVNATVPNTFARSAEVDGTIDIFGLKSGRIYIPHGTYVNKWTLTLTMTGTGHSPIVASDTQVVNGSGTNFGWITDFSFDNSEGLYDTIAYNYTNSDRDGSRARFMGVVLDGELAGVIPEPATMGLLSLAACGLAGYMRRRWKA